MSAFYNENDPKTAAWLRELIAAGLIAPGIVDERSITEIKAHELTGFTQCHFFAGIGGWSHALRLAGWDDDRPVWTGSAPCQPYSVASCGHGGAKGQCDHRDLWPDFNRIIGQCAPSVVIGEQVASAISWGWWDRAALDFEANSYAAAAAVLRADSFGAAHERKRLYWMAVASGTGRSGHQPLQRIFEPAPSPLAIYGDPITDARRALDGDFSHLLPSDGVSVVMERRALKGFGNAIVPKVVAAFIRCVMKTIDEATEEIR